MTEIRTRFAPSPTGPLHIGGVRTALYSYLFAKKHGGKFLLRIEDTDTARTVSGSEDIINESLSWCGIVPDEGVQQGGEFGPYKQSLRKEIYQKHAEILLENKKAYIAFDTEDEIKAWREKTAAMNNGISAAYNFKTRNTMRNSLTLSPDEVANLIAKNEPYVIRLKVDETDAVEFTDIIRENIRFEAIQLDDRILLKSDGMPTYHLANVVDDYLMKITHVIRGEEWLASTPHHILLYKAFGWPQPQFAHLPLFLKPNGKGKLSKRDGDALGFPVFAVDWVNPATGEVNKGFRERGFLPDAFTNFIAMLGWNDGTEREIFSMDELIQNFSLERVSKSGAKFNYEKALWFNQQYILKMTTEQLWEELQKEAEPLKIKNDPDFWLKYCKLFQSRIGFISQLIEIGSYMYSPIQKMDMETFQKKWKPELGEFINDFVKKLIEINIDSASLEHTFKKTLDEKGLKMGEAMPIFRILLTGIMQGPSVFETIELLGKEESANRLMEYRRLI